MAIIITVFVSLQLIIGFCALLAAIQTAPEGYENATGFHQLRSRRSTRPMVLACAVSQPVSVPDLHRNGQCSWE